MLFNSLRNVFLIFTTAFAFTVNSQTNTAIETKHIKVALRMIGHQILLNSGDSVSLVLPITNQNSRYKIEFGAEFEFEPEVLAKTVNKAVEKTDLAKQYIVEMVSCFSQEVVYSYEIGKTSQSNIVPCAARALPKACYQLLFTSLDKKQIASSKSIENKKSTPKTVLFLLALFIVLSIFFWFLLRKKKPIENPNMIQLGEFQFDKLNMILVLKEKKIELTSKESDLLLLLYKDVNKTIEKEVLLNSVWGDDGDYVGRTLDVFISKLRKKLEFDPKLKIVNVRGVGYKLIVGE